mmetsp:Transcript_54469/g.159029  ORF Transcript_54469/g.159029 Transcript_54469/m.159029 type:complete len:248 (-) Transcript_54469:283-1026(-)
MCASVAREPGETLPISLLESSGFSRTASFSSTRYLPPTSHGTVAPGRQERRGLPRSSPATGEVGEMLTRVGELPPVATRLCLCSFTTSMPSKFTGSSSRSPAVVSGLIQPRRPVPVPLMSARRRASPTSLPLPWSSPRSRTTTSSPGSTSPTSGLLRLASCRTVAGLFTRYLAFISQEPSSRFRTSDPFSLIAFCSTIHPGFTPCSLLTPPGTTRPTSVQAFVCTLRSSTVSLGLSVPVSSTSSGVA